MNYGTLNSAVLCSRTKDEAPTDRDITRVSCPAEREQTIEGRCHSCGKLVRESGHSHLSY